MSRQKHRLLLLVAPLSAVILWHYSAMMHELGAVSVSRAMDDEATELPKVLLNNVTRRTRDEALFEHYRYALQKEPQHYDKRCQSSLPPTNNRTFPAVMFEANMGLGHRLSHMAATANIAYRLKAGLFTHFRCCGKQEIFTHFFGAGPMMMMDEPNVVESRTGQADNNHTLLWQFRDVTFGKKLLKSTDLCQQEASQLKFQTDHRFYTELLRRFQYQHLLDEFMAKHEFAKHTVIGLHIRAGNGEGGDFEKKKRGIYNRTEFLSTMVSSLRQLAQDFVDPPLLFIATDTASMVDDLRARLQNAMKVVSYEAPARPEQGVESFWNVKSKTEQECLDEQKAAFVDHFLLANADVVVAAKASSFVHATPLSIALGRDMKRRKVAKPFCEVLHIEADRFSNNGRRERASNSTNKTLLCFDSMTNWCLERKQEGAYPPMIFFLEHDQPQRKKLAT